MRDFECFNPLTTLVPEKNRHRQGEYKNTVIMKVREKNGRRTIIRTYTNIHNGKEGNHQIRLPAVDGGVYGVVTQGSVLLAENQTFHTIKAGHFFTTKKGAKFQLEDPQTVIVTVQFEQYKGVFTLGEIPSFGNLGYINGAYNRVLSGPQMKGLPCLNSLHIDVPIDQTAHTHPSTRVGVIMDGNIEARIYRNEDDKLPRKLILAKGDVFVMKPDTIHSFHKTDAQGDNPMHLVAFHPDSETGPTHEVAPMMTNSLVKGVSASDIPEIHTKTIE